jgi:hypothetical protein
MVVSSTINVLKIFHLYQRPDIFGSGPSHVDGK